MPNPKNVIGKGRPWRSGQSGNMNGRPRRLPQLDELLNKILSEEKKVSPWQKEFYWRCVRRHVVVTLQVIVLTIVLLFLRNRRDSIREAERST
jgi:hypothetical protein